ncbi:MAG: TetR/AcrR family transcriptional regulator [Ilumatobacter sp.]|uniref:TetR/AcrR family transcriptional regulator n=1 Tax=Ilumatobacter sp. TaxID=1967498 RepID=UPI00261FD863|nr:TetR/AcrR family transcriptional regulator [Ilumatobacter sp.]MDJ0771076.1 TetR/AcrR family transcriptional regulator [Ilumatobacter sp.]
MTPSNYHHGDLPNALRRAAVEVIDERGVGGFSLREVARRAGVSHTAPAHHFGDTKGLLTSVATEGFEALHQATSSAAALHDDPAQRLAAIGEAYVELGRTHHAHCEVMFRTDIVDANDGDLRSCGMDAYGVLEDTVREIIETDQLDVSLDDASWLCWSTMQGLVQLAPKLEAISEFHGNGPLEIDELVRRFTDLLVAGLRSRAGVTSA